MTENRTGHHGRQQRTEGGAPSTDRDRPTEERSFIEAGSGAANADAAPGVSTDGGRRGVDAPHARRARKTIAREEKPDQLARKEQQSEDRQEALIDEGVEETFPASDPVSVKRIT